MISAFPSLLRRAASKPLPVVLFRARQMIGLEMMRRTGAWKRVAAQRPETDSSPGGTTLISGDLPPLSAAAVAALREAAEKVMSSRFKILGADVPDLETCDFSSDWRYGHRWPPRYFGTYSFYGTKSEPVDVKFPWELSRFHYFVPVMCLQAATGPNPVALARILAVLSRWRDENPVAYSVNWYPMEASMRVVSLVILLELAEFCLARRVEPDGREKLLELRTLLRQMIDEHGRFVWATREFTDIRGNHFTANLVALLLAYGALSAVQRAPKAWYRYARRWIEKEILLQFLPDGVNFEKSCAYHKLVLELFMLAAIACDRLGEPLGAEARARLIAAARFSEAAMRPDGLAAGFGDGDGATALPFLLSDPRSHAAVVQLVRTWSGEQIGTQSFPEETGLCCSFLLGRDCAPPVVTSPGPETTAFEAGGFVVCRDSETGFFFMCDIGEVGLSGRGGHGHNDLLSFELMIDGRLVVLDPGCPCYSSDLDKKVRYRRTDAHATVQLFGEEIARMLTHRAIADDARPCDVRVQETRNGVVVHAAHTGYSRIAEGTRVGRTFHVDASAQRVVIVDEIRLPGKAALADWRFPIGDVAPVAVAGRTGLLGTMDGGTEITADLPLTAERSSFSEGYGRERTGQVLRASAELAAGSHEFRFELRRAGG